MGNNMGEIIGIKYLQEVININTKFISQVTAASQHRGLGHEVCPIGRNGVLAIS